MDVHIDLKTDTFTARKYIHMAWQLLLLMASVNERRPI